MSFNESKLTANVNEKANLIWAIADQLTGVYKPHEYGKVILPLTVLRRFDCILADTKQKVLKKNSEIDKKNSMKDELLKRARQAGTAIIAGRFFTVVIARLTAAAEEYRFCGSKRIHFSVTDL